MPHHRSYHHFVRSTKNRKPLLATRELREKLWQHIKENAKEKNITIDVINGYTDHFHCIVSFKTEDSAARIMQLIKGESSWWINKNKLLTEKFEWQDEYFCIGICDSSLDAVRQYVLNQEEHHRHKTFQEEYEQLMRRYGFE
jgi:putative transposase